MNYKIVDKFKKDDRLPLHQMPRRCFGFIEHNGKELLVWRDDNNFIHDMQNAGSFWTQAQAIADKIHFVRLLEDGEEIVIVGKNNNVP